MSMFFFKDSTMDAWGQLIGSLVSIRNSERNLKPGTGQETQKARVDTNQSKEAERPKTVRTSLPRAIVRSVSLFIVGGKSEYFYHNWMHVMEIYG